MQEDSHTSRGRTEVGASEGHLSAAESSSVVRHHASDRRREAGREHKRRPHAGGGREGGRVRQGEPVHVVRHAHRHGAGHVRSSAGALGNDSALELNLHEVAVRAVDARETEEARSSADRLRQRRRRNRPLGPTLLGVRVDSQDCVVVRAIRRDLKLATLDAVGAAIARVHPDHGESGSGVRAQVEPCRTVLEGQRHLSLNVAVERHLVLLLVPAATEGLALEDTGRSLPVCRG
mmetsp:Transcript_4007/g.9512  ORF Transcript_4007/g.9512 Transcript_4007/m.9512 type:complete len:234 (-) Transcript_4007:4424-5125(-)